MRDLPDVLIEAESSSSTRILMEFLPADQSSWSALRLLRFAFAEIFPEIELPLTDSPLAELIELPDWPLVELWPQAA